jgi:ribonucleoside-diphosphate reductase beta chain
METIHIEAYALLLETIGMPESEFGAFLEYEAMKNKHDYMQQFGVETNADIARTLAMFGGFTEGLQLFASFAMLMNFPRFNKMKGMGQIVSWSIRDESLHCEGIIKLYHAFNAETGCVTKSVAADIVDCCQTVVGMEDKFIDLAFEAGDVAGHDARATSRTTSASSPTGGCASWTCRSSTGEGEPAALAAAMLSGVEHANFFEARSTEYSKARRGASGTAPKVSGRRFDQMRAGREKALPN